MTDIPRGQGGDGSPQLDLEAIEERLAVGGTPSLAASDALVALVRRLQQESEERRDEAEEHGERAIRYGREARLAEEQVAALRGRVEELTALIERMLKIHGDDYDALVAADYETADGLHELAEEAWVTDARAVLARVVPEKETP